MSSDPPAVEAAASPRRIMVYGVTGSGKSTAAAAIARRAGLPLVIIDDLTWQPGWVPVPEDEQRRLIAEVVARDSWVLDHGYGAWLDLVLDRVELVVALDYPRWVSLGRLLRRSLRRVVTREPMCNGNVESWGRLLGPDSIIRWHFRSFARKRARIREWDARQDPPTLRLTSPRRPDSWMGGSAPLRVGRPRRSVLNDGA